MQKIIVRHAVQMAHRQHALHGQCERIHGHTWRVQLEVEGAVRPDGTVIDFAALKHALRAYLDDEFDHALLLQQDDPLVAELELAGVKLPGLRVVPWHPTTENFAACIADTARQEFLMGFASIAVEVWETDTNGARSP